MLPCRYCSTACQHSDWKTHKAQCVRRKASLPTLQPAETQQQPATGATRFSGSRRQSEDDQPSASLLRKMKKKGLVPITPNNEVEWYEMIQDSMSEDGKVLAWPGHFEPEPFTIKFTT